MKKIVSIMLLPFMGILLYFFHVNEISLFPCMFYKLTGFYCPGCGTGRCIIALFHLQFYQAFRYNAIGFVLFPFLLFYAQYQLLCWGFCKKDNLTNRIPKKLIQVTLILLIFYGVLRNISLFRWLTPTKL